MFIRPVQKGYIEETGPQLDKMIHGDFSLRASLNRPFEMNRKDRFLVDFRRISGPWKQCRGLGSVGMFQVHEKIVRKAHFRAGQGEWSGI
jgi:hypothetical protein